MSGQQAPDDTAQKMGRLAELAVRMGRELGYTLDYSENSVQQVEAILAATYDRLPKGRIGKALMPDYEKQLSTLSAIWGAYLGEVIRRQLGGEWSRPDLDMGWAAMLTVNGTRMSPPAKVRKRLVDGPEDSISFYYTVVKSKLTEEAQADQTKHEEA